ncbi:MAG: glucose 1-dehydrogenase [Pseudomonadota bacterium]
MADGRFQGQSVLITGAASGFGKAAAERFAREGARLCLSDIDLDALSTTGREIAISSDDLITLRADVSREEDVKAQVDAVLATFGTLDIAINNAGVAHAVTPLPEIDIETYERMMAVNARGVFLGLKYQLPPMLLKKRGAIVNVSSAAGLVGAGGLAAYAAAKHAVVGLTKAAADEAARANVRVNAVCPSFATTPLFTDLAEELATSRGLDREATEQRFSARIPMRRLARTEEVVQAILWAADPENTFMTGQALSIDGGLTAV